MFDGVSVLFASADGFASAASDPSESQIPLTLVSAAATVVDDAGADPVLMGIPNCSAAGAANVTLPSMHGPSWKCVSSEMFDAFDGVFRC